MVTNQTANGTKTFTALVSTTTALDLQVGQIKFPATQNASADANTLDDYEEGTFTPTIEGDTTAGTGTYTTQIGTYTKKGREVTAHTAVAITAHTGTGRIYIAGMPFTSNATEAYYSGHVGYMDNLSYDGATYSQGVAGYMGPSVTRIALDRIGSGILSDVVNMDTAFFIVISITYQV